MMLVRSLAAAAVVLVGATGCRATEWPSDADQTEFCAVVTADTPTKDQLDELRSLGTPENLNFEARRYLLDLDEGKQVEQADLKVFATYVADNC